MVFRAEPVRQAIQDFDFERLFLDELGWDHPPANQSVPVEGLNYHLEAVAEKSGLAAYIHRSAIVPPRALRMRIERGLAKQVHEHLLVFVDDARTRQVWQWVKRQAGQTPRYREHTFYQGQTGELLVQKLQPLAFSLDEEPSIAEVTERMSKGLNVDRVTRRFFDRFKTEHKAFLKLVKGIRVKGDREWYASLMLNRLMFVYFVQRKRFLDNDPEYLWSRLRETKQRFGPDQFFAFYRHFLRRFFHEGLGQRPEDREPDLNVLVGNVPYLNGGIFDVHELEQKYPDIRIRDEAFEKLFRFFSAYDWHLDERPLRADNEINPDVLGYIFEKYVNQKQMGAYYTKEDITGYIARNTILPRLFDRARKDCAIAFRPDSALWRLLSENPDRYIYPSLRVGVAKPLPAEIAAGLSDVAKRAAWNAPAADTHALPTETWREHIARRQRHDDIWEKLVVGEVQQINDLITLNLDIRQFAQDVILDSEGPELLRALWKAMRNISVLDPACGSGAFLFAALNVLEPLYDACIERMEAFIDELANSNVKHSPAKFSDFHTYLTEVERHPNRRYYILKSIVIGNLYGVDIMEEAVEICKLRLFLKLAAQAATVEELEPLPDIDFNIRAGNSLVGFANYQNVENALNSKLDLDGALPDIQERAELAAQAAIRFREMQTDHGLPAQDFLLAKDDLKNRLKSLGKQLDVYLASEFGIVRQPDQQDATTDGMDPYRRWQTTHHPFHWFIEFNDIMEHGGFSVVLGNPPYVQWRRMYDYDVIGYATDKCPDVYAAFVERSTSLIEANGRFGMILPISFQFSRDFDEARNILRTNMETLWASTFSRNPAALFDAGLGVRSTICLGSSAKSGGPCRVLTTRLHRWVEDFRPYLFEQVEYTELSGYLLVSGWSRIGSRRVEALFSKLVSHGDRLGGDTRGIGDAKITFKGIALYYISSFVKHPPCFNEDGTMAEQTAIKHLGFSARDVQQVALVLSLGKIALLWWAANGDDFNVTVSGLASIPVGFTSLTDEVKSEMIDISKEIQRLLQNSIIYTRYAGKWMGNYDVKLVRHLTDKADRLVLESLGLGAYWDDLELEYVRFLKMTGERPGTTRDVPTFL